MSSSATTTQPTTTSVDAKVASYRKWMGLGILGLLLVLGWVLLRPGFFVVQPIGVVPEGATMLYLSRGDNLNTVDSADGICLRMATGVNLLCRGMALGQFMKTYEGEIVVRLPYSEWMYEMTTDGKQFER
jgi:hypothetical protein